MKLLCQKREAQVIVGIKTVIYRYLLDSDPKFKYTFELFKEVQISFQNLSNSVDKHVEKLDGKMIVLMDSILAIATTHNPFENSVSPPQKVINLQNFSEDFDLTICKYSDSIGWVPLSTLRNDSISEI